MLPKYQNKSTPVILDSGPFLLLLIGLYDNQMIGKAKRLKDYKPIHFDILIQFLAGRKIFITPGVLAEVSNLSKIVVKKDRILQFFTAVIQQIQQISEYTTSKDIIIENEAFIKLGYTDTSVLVAAKDKDFEILTADFPLFSRCKNLGIKATHMERIKEIALEFT